MWSVSCLYPSKSQRIANSEKLIVLITLTLFGCQKDEENLELLPYLWPCLFLSKFYASQKVKILQNTYCFLLLFSVSLKEVLVSLTFAVLLLGLRVLILTSLLLYVPQMKYFFFRKSCMIFSSVFLSADGFVVLVISICNKFHRLSRKM